jgi:hypothetical protein
MNAESSRSHLICSLIVRLTNKRTGKESIGKLTLVDLAGSEVRHARVAFSFYLKQMLSFFICVLSSTTARGQIWRSGRNAQGGAEHQ